MFCYLKNLPGFIVNPDQELEVVRNVVEHNVNDIVDKINIIESDIQVIVRSKLQKHLKKNEAYQEAISQINKDIQREIELTTVLSVKQSEVEVRLEKLKEDLQKERESVPDDEELRKLFEQASIHELSIEKRKADIRAKYAGYNRAISCYVRNLGCRIVQGEPGIILFDFAYYGALKSKKPEFYVELLTQDEGKTWKLIGMNPDLECREKLAKLLAETNDTQGLLAYIRKLYKPLMDQRLAENNENKNTVNNS